VLEHFGRARVVLHPLRIEGHSRIGCEARAMGAVPAVLRSNPFAVGLDADGGALAVGTVDELPQAIADLLASPQRLEQLSAAGMRTAREQVDWDAFVERVDAAYGSRAEHPGRAAHAEIGAALRARHDLMERELAARVAERDEAREDLERHRRWLDRTNESLSWRMTAPLRATKRRLARMPR
jgi:hypothetical protein